MNDNVQILNKNGDMMSVEGIAHIHIPASNKKYLFYTLNEKVDNDLTKIYIAEEKEDGTSSAINDEEWDDIRKKMVRISHKEELTDINYLPFGENTFNVGEAKKLAVTSVAKQAFKDAQATHTISTNQTETPVVEGSSSFFTTPIENNAPVESQTNQNIFDNPIPPETSTVPVQNDSISGTPEVSTEINQPATSVENNILTETMVNAPEIAPTPVEPIVENNQQIPDVNVGNGMNQEMPVEQAPISVPESIEQIPNTVFEVATDNNVQENNIETQEVKEQKGLISDEDALKAIEVIQDYIEQEEAA